MNSELHVTIISPIQGYVGILGNQVPANWIVWCLFDVFEWTYPGLSYACHLRQYLENEHSHAGQIWSPIKIYHLKIGRVWELSGYCISHTCLSKHFHWSSRCLDLLWCWLPILKVTWFFRQRMLMLERMNFPDSTAPGLSFSSVSESSDLSEQNSKNRAKFFARLFPQKLSRFFRFRFRLNWQRRAALWARRQNRWGSPLTPSRCSSNVERRVNCIFRQICRWRVIHFLRRKERLPHRQSQTHLKMMRAKQNKN